MNSILQVSGLTKRFGGLFAVDGIDLEIGAGEIVGLIGANGAGKTTLVNLLAGELHPSAGNIRYRGRDVTSSPPYSRCAMGIVRTFQVPEPFTDLTVRENVMIGRLFGSAPARNTHEAGLLADEILTDVGLRAVRDHATATLTTAALKRLEIARALAADPSVLLLDEPLGGLNTTEARAALDLVREVRAKGISIIFIEHIVPAVMAVSDRVIVLANGRKLAEGSPETILNDDEVKRSYLGNVEAGAVRRSRSRLTQANAERR
ncbi:ABC transporter ATP-binding protein [Bradyrhizobium sp. LjRoot220]|uniref:ABC transporter ATP-binding protein n=1 Tax=Bradyrhizobium sp. LjRoot220 TaxID=3342284 RepID=UPI003ECE793D